MLDDISRITVGNVAVRTTNNRGYTPEEIAEMALARVVHVAEHAPSVIRDQALAFKDHVYVVLLEAAQEAVRSHNVTLHNRLRAIGREDLIPVLGV
jgi:hypothetical protein